MGFFINFLSFAPISSADETNYIYSPSKPNRYNTAFNFTKTVVTLIILAMFYIFCDNPVRIGKSMLGNLE